MTQLANYPDIHIEIRDFVATVEIRRPPNNFFDLSLIDQIASAFEALDMMDSCRAIVLCSQGKNFCAGNDFGQISTDVTQVVDRKNPLYDMGVRLFRTKKPSVGAIQGAAIGGGLGLAIATDFRVASPDARFAANFVLLGFHHGFGLTMTLPRLIGQQQANLMLYTGRRYTGEQALALGLCEYLVPLDELRQRAWDLAREMASAAPLAVQAVRATMRKGMGDGYAAATDWESAEQARLRATEDFKEGVKSVAQRRAGNFANR
jgi:enoyl-CoA hydratase/carnithine racemase